MALKLTNNATSRLATSLSNADTTVVLSAGDGDKFPTLSAGDWFPVTVVRANEQREIMYATARAGDVLTVQRGKENTAPIAFDPGDPIEIRATAGVFATFLPAAGGSVSGDLDVQGTLSAAAFSGDLDVPGALKQDGNEVWHAGNFDPSTKASLTGADYTGKVAVRGIDGAMITGNGDACIEVANVNGSTGDAGMAMIGFHCQGATAMKIGLRHDGYFGTGGWSHAPWQWYVDGSGNMVAAGNVSAYSDPRLKDDIEPIGDALSIVRGLDGVRFTWNSKTRLVGAPGKRDIGVLADQVQAVLPELVGLSIPDDANGGTRWKVVAYDKIVPVLIEAVKELDARLQRVEA